VSAIPVNSRSEVRRVCVPPASTGAIRAMCRSPESLTSSASTRRPDPSAASTNLNPSTPTNPWSPRSPAIAARNSLSQRLSRLVIAADGADAERLGVALLDCAMCFSVTNRSWPVKCGKAMGGALLWANALNCSVPIISRKDDPWTEAHFRSSGSALRAKAWLEQLRADSVGCTLSVTR